MDKRKNLLYLSLLSIWVVLFPKPVYAFDPMIAVTRSLEVIKYFLIIAAVIGFIKAIGKAQVMIALTIMITAIGVFSILDPVTFKSVGQAVLSYLTIIGDSSPAIEQAAPAVPLAPTPID